MAGVCFYFEDEDVDVWSGKNLDAWNYACMAAGDIDKIVVINKTQQALTTPGGQYDFKTVTSLEDANLQGVIAQIVCPWNDFNLTELWDFSHAVDWYVFGPAAGWGSIDIGDVHVTIPVHGLAAMHSVHAASVVLAHRYKVTSWQ